MRREAVVVVVRRVRLQVCVVDGVPLALRVGLRREDLLRAVEAFLRFLGVEEEVNFVFGAGGAASLSGCGWESAADLRVAARLLLLLVLVDDLVGEDEGMMDILKQLLVCALPAGC